MSIRTIALFAAALAATPVHAQSDSSPAPQPIVWDLIDEYPATAIPGEAEAFFAEAARRLTSGRVIINTIPDAKSGLRTREQLKAVTEGRHAMANTLAGALADESPVFLLSSLPFVTGSAADARALAESVLARSRRVHAPWVRMDAHWVAGRAAAVADRVPEALVHYESAIAELEDKIRALAVELIEGVLPRGHCEFVDEIGQALPIGIFLDLAALPRAMAEVLRQRLPANTTVLSVDEPPVA